MWILRLGACTDQNRPLGGVARHIVAERRTIAAQPVGEDWYRANAWLLARIRPGEALWAYPNETALPLSYALMDKGRTLPIRHIPAPVPALAFPGAHPAGTPGVVAMDARQIAALLTTPAATAPHTIWLVGLASDHSIAS